MNDRGKAVEVSSSNSFTDYYSLSNLPCRKHPSSSSVGICAYCLKDRLLNLVCSDCGEQRLSSCSCSDLSSYPNSCTVEVGSVGRISFLIENDKANFPRSNSKMASEEKTEVGVVLKRSRSSTIDVKRSGIWRFRRFFRKKMEKGFGLSERFIGGSDEKRVKKGGFVEFESGSKVVNKSSFPVSEEAEFIKDVEKSGFIDLKLGFSSESKPKFSGLNIGGSSESESEFGGARGGDLSNHGCGSFGHLRGDEIWSSGSSYTITVNENGIRKSNKSLKVLRWIFRH